MKKMVGWAMVVLFGFWGMATAEFIDNEDGTVTDTATGLVWQQATGNAVIWEDALSYCENLILGDHDDWRLPDRNELQSLVNYTTYDPAIDETFPDTQWSRYWSSTTYVDDPYDAWLVNFNDGYVSGGFKSDAHYVRAVRDIP